MLSSELARVGLARQFLKVGECYSSRAVGELIEPQRGLVQMNGFPTQAG